MVSLKSYKYKLYTINMPTITFDPAQIGTNLTSITSNQTVASDAESDAAVASGAASDAASDAAVADALASDAESDAAVADSKAVVADALASGAESDASVADSKAVVASGAASDAASDAGVASGAASDAQSDVDVVEADDKFAKSIWSDPSSESFALLTMQITSASTVDMSHSATPV